MIEAIVILLFGLTSLWATRYWVRLRRQVRTWPLVRGRVTQRQSIQPTDRGRSMGMPAFRWAPDVRFSYRVGGADYIGDKIWLPWSWTNTRKKADAFLATIPDDVDVRYDPADPKTSCLYPPAFANVLWYGIAGVLLFGGSLLWILVNVLLMI